MTRNGMQLRDPYLLEDAVFSLRTVSLLMFSFFAEIRVLFAFLSVMLLTEMTSLFVLLLLFTILLIILVLVLLLIVVALIAALKLVESLVTLFSTPPIKICLIEKLCNLFLHKWRIVHYGLPLRIDPIITGKKNGRHLSYGIHRAEVSVSWKCDKNATLLERQFRHKEMKSSLIFRIMIMREIRRNIKLYRGIFDADTKR